MSPVSLLHACNEPVLLFPALPDVTQKLINSDTAGADFVPIFTIGCNYHDVRPNHLLILMRSACLLRAQRCSTFFILRASVRRLARCMLPGCKHRQLHASDIDATPDAVGSWHVQHRLQSVTHLMSARVLP